MGMYDLLHNLATSHTGVPATLLARTISTQGHCHWRLPVKIAEPKKRAYNGDGDVFCPDRRPDLLVPKVYWSVALIIVVRCFKQKDWPCKHSPTFPLNTAFRKI
jgi:hypothetical protein